MASGIRGICRKNLVTCRDRPADWPRRARPAGGCGCKSSSWKRPDAPGAPGWCGCRSPFEADGWQNCASKHPHTTHKLSFARIEYPHHPFYGMEVEVIRTLRQTGEAIDIIRLPDRARIAVPRWMLDPALCSQLPHEPSPRVALGALMRLAEIVENGRLSLDEAGAGWHASKPNPSQHVHRKTLPILPRQTAVSQEVTLGSPARSKSRPMPHGIDRTAPTGRPRTRHRTQKPQKP